MAEIQDTPTASAPEAPSAKPKPRRRMLSPHVTVHVSQEEIENSVRRTSSHCMIAEAIKKAVPTAQAVSVDLQSVRWTDPKKALRYIYFTPRPAQIALIQYDRGTMPEPFDVKLERATQVVRARSAYKKKYASEAERNAGRKEMHRRNAAAREEHLAISDHTERGTAAMGARRAATHRLRAQLDDPLAHLGSARAVNFDGTHSGKANQGVIIGGNPPPLSNVLGGDTKATKPHIPGNMAKLRRFGLRMLME